MRNNRSRIPKETRADIFKIAKEVNLQYVRAFSERNRMKFFHIGTKKQQEEKIKKMIKKLKKFNVEVKYIDYCWNLSIAIYFLDY